MLNVVTPQASENTVSNIKHCKKNVLLSIDSNMNQGGQNTNLISWNCAFSALKQEFIPC